MSPAKPVERTPRAGKKAGKARTQLHPRSLHRDRYDFKQLTSSCPELAAVVKPNVYGDESVDFADPAAVRTLNKALLKFHYQIDHWDIPEGYLCPPIPGRADYLHYIADLLAGSNYGHMPPGEKIRVLDIGVGASCIYPLIGCTTYGWSFIGSETDGVALDSARRIILSNPKLKEKVELKIQENPKDYFYGILRKDDKIDFTVCNPPFHASAAEAQATNLRKIKNLKREKPARPNLNFGGQSNELWCEGGEKRFVGKMIRESRKFSTSCFWFTSLVSKETSLKAIYATLKKVAAEDVKTIPMGQGNKKSRIVAWTFLTGPEQKKWKEARWQ